jgi:ABC-type sugar transport system permease subunit
MSDSTCYTCSLELNVLAWALLTLILTVAFHAAALMVLAKVIFTEVIVEMRHRSALFSLTVFSSVCVVVIFINSIEVSCWGFLYYFFGATENPITALTHSMGAFTTYGNSAHFPDDSWRLVSHLEAMNGLIAFGITTAFLYSASGRLHDFAK